MLTIENKSFAEERALYHLTDAAVVFCRFEGEADGESALKEGKNLEINGCFFALRYPLWHVKNLKMRDSRLTESCRAALWYGRSVLLKSCALDGIKAVRECRGVRLEDCYVHSPEFGWKSSDIHIENSTIESEYAFLDSRGITAANMDFSGKYSFQYIEDAVFEDCDFDTKDAFWHAKNVVVKNSTVKGEYLAWYCENVTFDHCRIIGTQPLCYCKGLKLIDCEMVDTDLAFERSQVEATVTTPVLSIKNPLSGHITVPAVGEIIRDIDGADAAVVIATPHTKGCA